MKCQRKRGFWGRRSTARTTVQYSGSGRHLVGWSTAVVLEAHKIGGNMLEMLEDPRSVRSIHSKKATAACTVRQHVWGTDVYESAYRNTKCRVVVWF